uniref:Uncharacterized protein n=1 Tax=Plectus sambesii TaxID=2011161 RepID=A0A914W1J5_9BILA
MFSIWSNNRNKSSGHQRQKTLIGRRQTLAVASLHDHRGDGSTKHSERRQSLDAVGQLRATALVAMAERCPLYLRFWRVAGGGNKRGLCAGCRRAIDESAGLVVVVDGVVLDALMD